MVFGTGSSHKSKFCWNCLAILPVNLVGHKPPIEDETLIANYLTNSFDRDEPLLEWHYECTKCSKPIINPEGKYEL